MLENYQKILETENLDSEEKSSAQEEIQRINKEKNAIMIAENLIKTKGFEDVVLFVNNGNVTGVIKAEKLDEQQISQIQNIITRELNVKVNKINISSKKQIFKKKQKLSHFCKRRKIKEKSSCNVKKDIGIMETE